VRIRLRLGLARVAAADPRSLKWPFAAAPNVGKSSLVNALLGRRTLARVSANPGHTRQINFYDLADTLTLVDLRATASPRSPSR